MSELNVRLGERVRALRMSRGIAQGALAEAAGMSQTTLSRLEKGHQSPSLEGIERIARALGVSIAMVVDFEDEIGQGGQPIEQLMQQAAVDSEDLRDRLRRALEVLFAGDSKA